MRKIAVGKLYRKIQDTGNTGKHKKVVQIRTKRKDLPSQYCGMLLSRHVLKVQCVYSS